VWAGGSGEARGGSHGPDKKQLSPYRSSISSSLCGDALATTGLEPARRGRLGRDDGHGDEDENGMSHEEQKAPTPRAVDRGLAPPWERSWPFYALNHHKRWEANQGCEIAVASRSTK